MTSGPLSDADLRILLRQVQRLEATYLMPNFEKTHIENMRADAEAGLAEQGYRTATQEQAREQIYRLGARVRRALGEDLEDDGSPSPDTRIK